MPGRAPSKVSLSPHQRALLKQITRAGTSPQREVERARVVLSCADGLSNRQVARKLGISRNTVKVWRDRFAAGAEALGEMESKGEWKALRTRVRELLRDAHRCGTPPKFSAEQVCQIVALACERPDGESARPVCQWTPRELAAEAVTRAIIAEISARHVGRLLAEADLKPHLSRYWLNANPENPKAYKEEVRVVCDCYLRALELFRLGIHLVSTDEMTGIQALERKYETKSVEPGRVERREYEYIRHGTTCLIANWHVAMGKVITPSLGPTRTEQDYEQHIRRTVATDPDAGWIFIHDQLNTHQSEALVRSASGDGARDHAGRTDRGEKGG